MIHDHATNRRRRWRPAPGTFTAGGHTRYQVCWTADPLRLMRRGERDGEHVAVRHGEQPADTPEREAVSEGHDLRLASRDEWINVWRLLRMQEFEVADQAPGPGTGTG